MKVAEQWEPTVNNRLNHSKWRWNDSIRITVSINSDRTRLSCLFNIYLFELGTEKSDNWRLTFAPEPGTFLYTLFCFSLPVTPQMPQIDLIVRGCLCSNSTAKGWLDVPKYEVMLCRSSQFLKFDLSKQVLPPVGVARLSICPVRLVILQTKEIPLFSLVAIKMRTLNWLFNWRRRSWCTCQKIFFSVAARKWLVISERDVHHKLLGVKCLAVLFSFISYYWFYLQRLNILVQLVESAAVLQTTESVFNWSRMHPRHDGLFVHTPVMKNVREKLDSITYFYTKIAFQSDRAARAILRCIGENQKESHELPADVGDLNGSNKTWLTARFIRAFFLYLLYSRALAVAHSALTLDTRLHQLRVMRRLDANRAPREAGMLVGAQCTVLHTYVLPNLTSKTCTQLRGFSRHEFTNSTIQEDLDMFISSHGFSLRCRKKITSRKVGTERKGDQKRDDWPLLDKITVALCNSRDIFQLIFFWRFRYLKVDSSITA